MKLAHDFRDRTVDGRTFRQCWHCGLILHSIVGLDSRTLPACRPPPKPAFNPITPDRWEVRDGRLVRIDDAPNSADTGDA